MEARYEQEERDSRRRYSRPGHGDPGVRRVFGLVRTAAVKYHGSLPGTIAVESGTSRRKGPCRPITPAKAAESHPISRGGTSPRGRNPSRSSRPTGTCPRRISGWRTSSTGSCIIFPPVSGNCPPARQEDLLRSSASRWAKTPRESRGTRRRVRPSASKMIVPGVRAGCGEDTSRKRRLARRSWRHGGPYPGVRRAHGGLRPLGRARQLPCPRQTLVDAGESLDFSDMAQTGQFLSEGADGMRTS